MNRRLFVKICGALSAIPFLGRHRSAAAAEKKPPLLLAEEIFENEDVNVEGYDVVSCTFINCRVVGLMDLCLSNMFYECNSVHTRKSFNSVFLEESYLWIWGDTPRDEIKCSPEDVAYGGITICNGVAFNNKVELPSPFDAKPGFQLKKTDIDFVNVHIHNNTGPIQ